MNNILMQINKKKIDFLGRYLVCARRQWRSQNFVLGEDGGEGGRVMKILC